jgi:uncharacterized protein YndB with AHSA1/START domain
VEARCSVTIDRPRARVFEVLIDPYAYPRWVVGARRIRSVDALWPASMTCFYHEVGAGPLRIKDKTTMVETRQDMMVKLRARVWPAGEAEVSITLTGDGDVTTVTLEEQPSAGPVSALPAAMTTPALHMRNLLSLRRLKRLVESLD